jgi:hypothetical protein
VFVIFAVFLEVSELIILISIRPALITYFEDTVTLASLVAGVCAALDADSSCELACAIDDQYKELCKWLRDFSEAWNEDSRV